MENSDNNSINTLDKLLYKNCNKNKYLSNGKIIINNGNIEFKLIDKNLENKKKFNINYNDLDLENKEEEFLDDSEINSKTDTNNFTNQDYDSKKRSLCYVIDDFFNKILTNDKKLGIKLDIKQSDKRFSNLDWTKEKIKKKFNSCINKFNLLEINNLLNKIDKNLLVNSICSICYSNYSHDEEISMINKCLHIFHYNCLDNWIGALNSNKNHCPYCKLVINEELVE